MRAMPAAWTKVEVAYFAQCHRLSGHSRWPELLAPRGFPMGGRLEGPAPVGNIPRWPTREPRWHKYEYVNMVVGHFRLLQFDHGAEASLALSHKTDVRHVLVTKY